MWRATLVLGLVGLAVLATANPAKKVKEVDNDRIVGGRTAMIKQFPCVVSLQRREVHVCGGTILSPNFILTAAHCGLPLSKLALSAVTIRAGATIWSTGGQHVGVKKIVNHPKYDPKSKIYDFCIMQLEKPLEFDNITVQACKLADKIPGDGKSGYICGWGLKREKADMIPNMLQFAEVKSISKEKCGSKLFDYGEGDIQESMICAQNTDIDACQGDSGGPYFSNEGVNIGSVWGVISFGKGCGRPGYPGVYGSVASVKNWIAKTIRELEPAETVEEPYPVYKPES